MGCKTLGQHTLCNKHLKLCTGDMTYKSLCLFLCLPSALVLAAFYSSEKPLCVVEFDTVDNDYKILTDVTLRLEMWINTFLLLCEILGVSGKNQINVLIVLSLFQFFGIVSFKVNFCMFCFNCRCGSLLRCYRVFSSI